MSFPIYGSCREQTPTDNVSLSIEPGGATTTAYNGNAYIQFQNRAGRNLLSDSIPISVPAGSIAVFTFNEGLIESGEEVFWLVLSLGSTPQNAIMVARIATTEADQITKKPFPLVIRLLTNEHFSPSSVAGIGDLPSTDVLYGQIVLVEDEATYYIYDEWSLSWQPFPQGRSAYLESTTAAGGCDRLLTDVDSALRVPAKVGSNDTIPLRVWWLNGFFPDGGSPVEANTRLSLEISINGSTTSVDGKSFSTLFSNRIKANLVGYVERATGILDLSQAQGTTIWNPVINFLVLPEELPRGYAAVWDLVLSFENEVMLGVIGSGASIDINLVEVSENVGTPSPLAALIGDLVFAQGDLLRIVPTPKRLSGLASVKGGYTINSSKELLFPGLLAEDTPNQRITLLGSLNGFIQVKQEGEELLPDEIVRAIASTEAGKGQAVSTDVTVAASSAIEVTVVHPITVRDDYPDVIAGSDKGSYTPSVGRVGISDGTTYYEENTTRSLGTGESIAFTITDLTDFTPTTLHTPDADFDLFRSQSITATEVAGAGSMSGTYTIYFFAEYESPNTSITRITHDPENGAVKELEDSLVELGGGGDPYLVVNSAEELPQAIGNDAIACGEISQAEGLRAIAIGYQSLARDNSAIALGDRAKTLEFSSDSAIAIGRQARAQGDNGIAIGTVSYSSYYGVALGYFAVSNGSYSVAMSESSLSNGSFSIAIGFDATTEGYQSLALGAYAWGQSAYSIALGVSSRSDGGNDTIAIGRDSQTDNPLGLSGEGAIAIGYSSHAKDAQRGIAFGYDATAQDAFGCIAIGSQAIAQDYQAIALGSQANASGSDSVVIGSFSSATDYAAISLGTYTLAEASESIAIGAEAYSGQYNDVSIGAYAYASGSSSTAIGAYSYTPAETATAIGVDSSAEALDSVALGSYTTVDTGAERAVQLGIGTNPNADTLQYQDITIANNIGLEIPQTASDPNGLVTARQGTLLLETASNLVYLNTDSAASWQVIRGGGREVVTSDLTYYVSPTGNDSNDGLSNGTPFLTIQQAIDAIAGLDWAGIYQPTIQLADGTYSYAADINLKSVMGADRVIIQGNSITPSNVVVEITSPDTFAFRATNINSIYSIENLKIVLNQTTTSSFPSGAIIATGCYVEANNIVVEGVDVQSNPIQWFRSQDNGILFIPSGGNLEFLPYTAGTPSQYVGFAATAGIIRMNGVNFTLTSTPNFSVFLSATRLTSVFVNGFTTSGTATGQKFEVAKVANILAGGNAANLPGDVAGVVDTASFGNIE